MAIGDIIVFNKFDTDLGDKVHNLSTDTFYFALITNGVTPIVSTSDPRWGAGGGTNLAAFEVTPGGNYSAGGIDVSAVITDNWITVANIPRFTVDDVAISKDASNPSNARWGIIYNNTDAGKRCVLALDLGQVQDLTTGPFNVTWPTDGLFDITRPA